MPTNAEIRERYTEHGLQLVRFSNALALSSARELRRLSRELRALLAQYDPGMSRIELRRLLKRVEETIALRYGAIAATQDRELRQLIGVETRFALRAAGLSNTPSAIAREAAQRSLLVHGAPVSAHWARQGQNLAWSVSAVLRTGPATGADARSVIASVLGTGRAGREQGGLLETATRNARSLADSGMQAATNAGHLAAYKANRSDVNAIQWFAILDARLCPNCGMRAGKLYTLDYEPIGHDIDIGSPPPLHPFCRCILTPMRFPNGVPEDGGPQAGRFQDWLERQSPERQDELLGAGRADLWREGKITLNDLIGQNGMVMSLSELRRKIGDV